MKGKMKGKKIKAIILIAVFILSTIALVNADVTNVPIGECTSVWTMEEAQVGIYSLHVEMPDADTPGTAVTDAGVDIVAWLPAGITLAEITEIKIWEYIVTPGDCEENIGATIILNLDTNDNGEWDGTGAGGDVQILLETSHAPDSLVLGNIGKWDERDVFTDYYDGWDKGDDKIDPSENEDITFFKESAHADVEVLGVGVVIGWGFYGSYDGYIDDFTVNGVTYPIEPSLEYIGAEFLATDNAAAEWALDSTEFLGDGHVAKISLDSDATGLRYAYVRVYPDEPYVTIAELRADPETYIPRFLFRLGTATGEGADHPDLQMRFESPDGSGFIDITVFPTPAGGGAWYKGSDGAWHEASGLTGAVYGVAYGEEPDGTPIALEGGSYALDTILTDFIALEADDEDFTTWELVRVAPQFWGNAPGVVAYIDHVKIGSTFYDLEPTPVLNKEWYHTGDTATVSLYNNLENRDPTTVDLVPVWIAGDSDTGKTIVLTETGPDTDSFRGSFGLVATTPGTGELLVRADDNFWVNDYAIGGIYDVGTIDDTYPTVDTLRPVEDDITTDNRTTISAYVHDEHLKSAYMTVDGEFRGIPRSAPGTMTYTPDPLNLLSEGLHTVVVTAEDLAGNENETIWYFTVDTMKPTATIRMNVTGDVKAGYVEFYADFSEEMNGTAPVPAIWTNATTYLDFPETDDGWMTIANTTYGYNATISGDYNGSAQVNVTLAKDLAGNVMTKATYMFYIDTVDPTAPGKLNATALADSIALEWLASTDFGGMDNYTVYRGTATDECNDLVDSVDHPILTFKDTTLLASGIYFYEVVAYDEAGNSATSNEASATFITAQVTSYNISLAKDWNLFSHPLIPDDTSIEVVLADVMGNVTIVYSYQNGTWLTYIPAQPSLSTLTTIEDGKGYWIQMKLADNFTATGVELPDPDELPPVYPVTEGYNMIGFKSVDPMKIEIYLTTIPALELASSVCYGWDATLQQYAQVYVGLVKTDGSFEPGYGYWLFVPEDANIAPLVPSIIVVCEYIPLVPFTDVAKHQ